MEKLKELFMNIDGDRKRLFYLIGGSVLAVLLIAIVLSSLFGGTGKKYGKLYAEAETAYLAKDYERAEDRLRRALELKSTEEAYLLLADVYCAQGDTDRAIQILYLGYSRLGGDAMSKKLEQLKSSAGAPSVTPAPETALRIGDTPIESGTTSLVLTNTRLSQQDIDLIAGMEELESLGLSNCELNSVSFLSGLRGLTFLQISDNAVSDLRPLIGMTKLKTLYIDNNPVADLAPLYSLGSLRTLSMKGIEVSAEQLAALRDALPSCSVYADAPAVEAPREFEFAGRTISVEETELDLSKLGLTDISPLRACTKLTKLDLRDNRITDLSPLVDLPNLEWLCIWNNEVEDIYPLLSLGKLKYLDADGNRISDISVLEYLPGLEQLWLNHDPLSGTAPLKGLTRLKELGLADTGIDDDSLDDLMGLKSLQKLNIKGNEGITAAKFDELQEALPLCEIKHDDLISTVSFGDNDYETDAEEISAVSQNIEDLSALERFTALKVLKLGGNRVSDLSPLAGLNALEELWLYGNRVSDLRPLAGHSALRVLDLQGNQVRDLSPLADCVHLRTLLLSGNGIESVMPLAGCTELTELDLDGNEISDLSALAPLTSLQTLHLDNNRISDLSALYSLVQLKTLYVRGNPLTADDIRALQTMLPGCVILHDLVLTEDDLTDPVETPRPSSGTDLG